jgi:hypothetical protein
MQPGERNTQYLQQVFQTTPGHLCAALGNLSGALEQRHPTTSLTSAWFCSASARVVATVSTSTVSHRRRSHIWRRRVSWYMSAAASRCCAMFTSRLVPSNSSGSASARWTTSKQQGQHGMGQPDVRIPHDANDSASQCQYGVHPYYYIRQTSDCSSV